MSELKPCPFCGRKPYERGGYVSCHTEECMANADYHEPAIGSIEDWNTRPIEDELRARIAELEAVVDKLIWSVEGRVEFMYSKHQREFEDIVAEYKEREE